MAFQMTTGERVFRVFNYSFLLVLGVATLYPFWYVLQASLTDPLHKISYFLPKGGPNGLFYANYYKVFEHGGIWQAYLISVLRVIAAVPLMVLITGGAAFALTRRDLFGRKTLIFFFLIVMFVNGGLIPLYMVFRTFGLLDSFWVLVLPFVFTTWTMIVMKTSFQTLPEGLVEAGIIDGANYMSIFFRIVLPLSIPMVATLALFTAVSQWNEWFYGAFFIRNTRLRPLQTFLRVAVLATQSGGNISYALGFQPYRELQDLSGKFDPRLFKGAIAGIGSPRLSGYAAGLHCCGSGAK